MCTKIQDALPTDLAHSWSDLILNALNRNSGELLSGLVHNLHNHAHTLTMQTEMWTQTLQRSGQIDASSFQRSLKRVNNVTSDFAQDCQNLGDRGFYSRLEPTWINLASVLNWLSAFWRHNLFFKHHMDMKISVQDQVPEGIHVVPAALTYCLEEGLKNAIEALSTLEHRGETFTLHVHGAKTEHGVHIALSAPTVLDQDIDPWQSGSSTKTGHLGMGLPLMQACCQQMGWTCALHSNSQETTLDLEVVESKETGDHGTVIR